MCHYRYDLSGVKISILKHCWMSNCRHFDVLFSPYMLIACKVTYCIIYCKIFFLVWLSECGKQDWEFLLVMLQKTTFFWFFFFFWLGNSHWYFILDCVVLKTKVLWFFRTLITANRTPQEKWILNSDTLKLCVLYIQILNKNSCVLVNRALTVGESQFIFIACWKKIVVADNKQFVK
jgi:hypothetical protein